MTTLRENLEDLYKTDYYAWTQETARLLREGRFSEIDGDALAEEVESLGKRELRELENRLEIVLDHMAKLYCAKSEIRNRNERGWILTIKEQRLQIEKILQDSPALVSKLASVHEEAWKNVARLFPDRLTVEERQRPLPSKCPWTIIQVFQPDFFPEILRTPSKGMSL